jgi:hypothetical protein
VVTPVFYQKRKTPVNTGVFALFHGRREGDSNQYILNVQVDILSKDCKYNNRDVPEMWVFPHLGHTLLGLSPLHYLYDSRLEFAARGFCLSLALLGSTIRLFDTAQLFYTLYDIVDSRYSRLACRIEPRMLLLVRKTLVAL